MGNVNMGICPITITVVGTVMACHFVNTQNAIAGDGDNTLGVAVYDGTDEPTTVDTAGVVTVKAGAAFAAGSALQSDANGCAIALAAGQKVARALDEATVQGDMVRVVLINN